MPTKLPTTPDLRIKNWHSMSGDEVLGTLGTSAEGLSREEAAKRLAEHGPNQLQGQEGPSRLSIFLRQFKSPLIYILLAAAVVAFFVGKRIDVWVILGVVLGNALIGALQEIRAAGAIAALQRLTSPHSKVLRDGEIHEMPTTDLTIGDILVLTAGDRVGADARILQTTELTIDESGLTGESVPVSKTREPLEGGNELPLGDRTNMAYMNTVVTQGRGRAVVVAVGMATEMGKIASEVSHAEGEAPIQRRLAAFSRRLGLIIMGAIAVVLGIGLLLGRGFAEMFYVAISLAVAAIPEGLPIVVSILLAIGVRRMARRRALIRRLPAVESLGSATVICSDKTGTLTRNEMTVQRLAIGEDWLSVEGIGYRPEGRVLRGDRPVDPARNEGIRWLRACARLCNDALLVEEHEEWRVLGDPTEGALVVLAEKLGSREDWDRLHEIPFSSERKWMATLNLSPEGERVVFVKGAIDRLLPMASGWMDLDGNVHPFDDAARERLIAASEAMANDALRLMLLAMMRGVTGDHLSDCEFETDLVILGLAGMIDPARTEAIEAIRVSQEAGIRVVMITGDHQATAVAIARQMGILRGDPAQRALDGAALERMSCDDLAQQADTIDVYARVSPSHKLDIVRALQKRGQIVAMTGDGVNDAPALSQADVGIAMGITGTEVAKGASDVVLADDNFATIEAAVEEGRIIADNLRKVIPYLMTTAIGSIGTIAGAIVLGLPLPLVALQILWINLVTDGVFDKTLALERGEPDLMRRPPIRPNAPLIPWQAIRRMFMLGFVMIVGTLGIYTWSLAGGAPLEHARTQAFMTLVAYQWFSALAWRSYEMPLHRLPLNPWMLGGLGLAVALQLAALYAPPMQFILETVPLSTGDFLLAMLLASTLLIVSEGLKVITRRT